MKIKSLILLLIFIAINLYADKNWIKIESTNKVQTPKSNTKTDLNLSQIQPLNNILKNVTLVKKLLDQKREKEPVTNEKNWFVLNKENN